MLRSFVVALALLPACAGPPPQPTARPNVLLIVADDLGYTDLGVFGGEIGTPNLDALAMAGVRFTDFHAASTCSLTRAMLLTGLDNHRVGLGTMFGDQTPNQRGVPGYEGHLRRDVETLPEQLRAAGYRTYMSGKWHLGASEELSPAARGFDRSFALMNGGAAHLDATPMFPEREAIYREDGVRVAPPEDFYSTREYAERLIAWLEQDAGDPRPYFAYLAFTAPHWPLQAPDESIERFAGRYDDGYDALHARRIAGESATPWPGLPDRVPWSSLTDDARRVEARKMEIYAAMVHDLDMYVGRVLDALRGSGALDDTVVIFLSDNGAEGHDIQATWPRLRPWIAAELDNSYANLGRRGSYVDYGPEWARAGIGVARLYKGFATQGALRVPAFVSWPSRFPGGRTSDTFATVLDLWPTVLELAGAPHEHHDAFPRGRSLVPLLAAEAETVHGDEPVFAWELFGRGAVRVGDWKLVLTTTPHGSGAWELFDLRLDPGELRDLSAVEPDRRAELLEVWQRYVEANGVVMPDRAIPF